MNRRSQTAIRSIAVTLITLGAIASGSCARGARSPAVASARAPTAPSAYATVAREYFALEDARLKQMHDARYGSGLRLPRRAAATGRVTDRWGMPVAGADVRIVKEGEDAAPTGIGATGPDGNFDIALSGADYQELSIEVNARGYETCEQRGLPALVSYGVVVVRTIDSTYLDALVRETDPDRRLRALIEMLSGRNARGRALASRFPYVGLLRNDLRELLESHAFERQRGNVVEQVVREARELLRLWSDPADLDVVWGAKAGDARRALGEKQLEGLSAATPEQFLRMVTEVDDRPPVSQKIVYSLDGNRALIEHSRQTGHHQRWVMLRDGGEWRVVNAMVYYPGTSPN